MNRRDFLRMTGTGLVATATMAEAGMLAEFLDWLKRKPVWSFAKPKPYIVPVLIDNVFVNTPLFVKMRQPPSWIYPFLEHMQAEMEKQSGAATIKFPVPGIIHIKRPRMNIRLTGIS